MINSRFIVLFFFFSSRRRHTRCLSDWSSDVCSSDLTTTWKVVLGLSFLPTKASKGKFAVVGKKLKPNTTFQVVVAGVPIGTLTTGPSGKGQARFSTQPRGRFQPLSVDPRGKRVTVHEMEDGEDELEGEMPDDDAGDMACCIAEDDEVECENRSESECLAEHGTPMSGASCLSHPCGGSAGGSLVACCEEDDEDAECELRTTVACGQEGGIAMPNQSSCDPNPCAPAGGETVRCCVADEDNNEGEGDQGEDDNDQGEVECELLTHQHCIDEGGHDIGPGSCSGNPCASPSGAFLDPDAGAL